MTSIQLARRPIGCLQSSLRPACQPGFFTRQFATAVELPPQAELAVPPEIAALAMAPMAPTGTEEAPKLSLPTYRIPKKDLHLPKSRFFALRVDDPMTQRPKTGFAVYAPFVRFNSRTPPRKHGISPASGVRRAFARRTRKWGQAHVYPEILAPSNNANKDPMPAFHKLQILRLDTKGRIQKLFDKKNPDCARVGDVLLINFRKESMQPFAGLLMEIRRAGVDSSVLLRTKLSGVAVEMHYKIFSRNISSIQIVKRKLVKRRRARLTFLRKPKHDYGNVDHLVLEWKRSRRVFTARKTTAQLEAAAKLAKRQKAKEAKIARRMGKKV